MPRQLGLGLTHLSLCARNALHFGNQPQLTQHAFISVSVGIQRAWYATNSWLWGICRLGTANCCRSFQKYGVATGYSSEAALLTAFRVFGSEYTAATEVGNVILENFTPLEKPVALNSSLNDLSVRYVYIDGNDPIAAYVGGLRTGAPSTQFALRDPDAAKRAAATRKVRMVKALLKSEREKTTFQQTQPQYNQFETYPINKEDNRLQNDNESKSVVKNILFLNQ